MKNPFHYWRGETESFTIQDRHTGEIVASGVNRAYVHKIVDLLNHDANPDPARENEE